MSDFFNKIQKTVKDSIPKNIDPKVGMLGATAVGGLLGALFGGTRSLQTKVRNIAAIGGGAALGSMAYKLFQKWTGTGSPEQPATGSSIPGTQSPINNDDPFAAYNAQHAQVAALDTKQASHLLLEAMIFAARADGHIDKDEQNMILGTANSLCADEDFNSFIRECLAKPLDPHSLAAQVKTPDQALDVYKFSAVAIVVNHPLEQQYLQDLANALKIDAQTKNRLDFEANALRAEAAQG